MENNNLSSETFVPGRAVRWKQNVAASFFVLVMILVILSTIVPQAFWIELNVDYPPTLSILQIINPLLLAGAFLLLRSISNNRMTRLALLILPIGNVLMVVTRILLLLVFDFSTIESLIDYSSTCGGVVFFALLASIYSFILILNNNGHLSVSNRVWIGFIFCYYLMDINMYIYNILVATSTVDISQIHQTTSIFYSFFGIMLYIMQAIALYKFAKSELFGGVYDDCPVPAKAYSIVNKYGASILVMIVLYSVTMYFVLSNADKLITL